MGPRETFTGFFKAEKLRKRHPPALPPKPEGYVPGKPKRQEEIPPIPPMDPNTLVHREILAYVEPLTAAQRSAARYSTNSMSKFVLLPALAPADRPKSWPRAFSINAELELFVPRHAHHLTHFEKPRLMAHNSALSYVSPGHTQAQVMDQLLQLAATQFALDLSERQRWRFELIGTCDSVRNSTVPAEFKSLMDASKKGGWTWTLKIIEVERNGFGLWSSSGRTPRQPIAVDTKSVQAPPGTVREV